MLCATMKTRKERYSRRPVAGQPPRPRPAWLLPVLAIVAVVIVGLAVLLARQPSGPAPWARLRTSDVHSLAFVGDGTDQLLFGHHGGLLQTGDGGRTWLPLPVGDDAMSTVPAADGSIVIAGHEVFRASHDGGQTWAPIASDLPSLDIHGFTRDPADPAHMWAYLAIGGLWESVDFGSHWERVREDNVGYPLAVRHGDTTNLLGVDLSGLVSSTDGGRSWVTVGAPPTYPMTSLAATPDGATIYAGSPEGLYRSTDGGRTWTETGYQGSTFATATSRDGGTVAVVSRETEFFRSDDGGQTWPGP